MFNLINIKPQPVKPTLPSQPPQPFIPTREEMMRLNSLNFAVQTKGADTLKTSDVLERAKKYYAFLAGEPFEEPEDKTYPADRRWWQI